MKIAIVTDTHFGVRSDSEHFDKALKQFFDEEFFPYLEKHKITTIIHLGDLFDRRKYVNYQILANAKECFLDKLSGYDVHIIPGNHDVYYKNTNAVNCLDLLLNENHVVNVHQKPVHLMFGKLKVALIPWITEDNETECLTFLNDSAATVCMGHFDIVGFKMTNGQNCEHGYNPENFSKFDLTLSGHFHHKSNKKNIHYLGCPFEQTWDDYESTKGFHVLDTDTLELTFIPNPNTTHKKIYYDDRAEQTINFSEYKGKIVKLVVLHKTNYEKFDGAISRLYGGGVLDLKIIEDLSNLDDVEDDDNVDLENTRSILSKYIDDADIKLDKQKLKTVVDELFVEAQNSEQV